MKTNTFFIGHFPFLIFHWKGNGTINRQGAKDAEVRQEHLSDRERTLRRQRQCGILSLLVGFDLADLALRGGLAVSPFHLAFNAK